LAAAANQLTYSVGFGVPTPTSPFFQSFSLKSLELKNRFVMAPMTRSFSPGGVPTADVAAYYRRRAEGEVGLILSEGTVIERPASASNIDYPHFYGEKALSGWKAVIDGVHEAGGKMGPQLWHVGVVKPEERHSLGQDQFEGPSGLNGSGEPVGKAMTEEDIADALAAYGRAARDAKALGFDMLEIHAAHSYLIDQFFWDKTNQRSDRYGGSTISERNRFGVEVVRAIRSAVGEEFVISFRVSQWKFGDFEAKVAKNPAEMEAWLLPLAEAGVDIFHCSQRRFWEPEYEGSDLNTAGWAKKVTGKATMAVGSVGLSGEFIAALRAGEESKPASLSELERRMDRRDFDLVAVGRALISDPDWVLKVRDGRGSELRGYDKEALVTLA
jgi:2,4-dienoyl-CoA reductase-like NADH-dependent reductase (Old Yellow Enzyme family)